MVIKHKLLNYSLLYICLLIIFIIYIVPLFWIVSTSFKLDKDAYILPPQIIFKPTFINYINAFNKQGMLQNFIHSVILCISCSTFGLLIGTPAAYAISRFKFKNKEKLFFWILTTRMAPPMLAVIPYFVLAKQTGIYDTMGLLVVVNTLLILSWVIWMMRSFFDEIPKEIDEAGLVDGCNRLTLLVRIILPLAKPGLVATSIFSIIMVWNEYLFSLVLTSVNAKTIPLIVSTFLTVQGLYWGQMCAVGTVIILPVLIFTIFAQKNLVRGLTMGSVKG
jgi:multiple sugar transport system permease protein